MGEDPTLSLLLDPDRLSALLRRPVRVTRVRPKPGVSHTAVLMGSDGAVQGWVQALIGQARVKGAKTRSRAQELGVSAELSTLPLPQWDADLLWGSIATDPDLMKTLSRTGLDLGDPQVRLLRYNPMRRVVVRHGDHVVRVSTERHRREITSLTVAMQRAGLPVLTPVPAQQAGLRVTSRLSVWPWVVGHDLAHAHTEAQLGEVGDLLARLHRIEPSQVIELPERGWHTLRNAAGRAVDQLERVAPQLAPPARQAWASLPQDLAGSEPVVLHGDFSLDQCLVGPDRVWLNDLDRACIGPRELDLASVQAAALVADPDAPAGLGSVFEGYGRTSVPDAWVSAAVLGRISEAWRMQEPGWQGRTARLAQVALSLSRSGRALPVGASSAATLRTTPPVAWRVPPTVQDSDGTVVQVERAWPDKAVDGVARIAVEGHDGAGLLRAGTLGVDGALRLLPHGEDRRLPALADVARTGSLLVHRPGRRAVVHGPDGYTKVVRPGRAAGVAATSRSGAVLVEQVGLRTAPVLEVTDDTVRFEALPGTPVQRLSGDADWSLIWQTWATAWAGLQLVELGDLPVHGAADEARVLHTWRDRAQAAGVLAGTAWATRLTGTAAALDAAMPTRLVPTHRDLHDGQLLWDGQHLAVLDLDTVCRAEPALDLANLAAHAGLRQAQGLWSEEAAEVVTRTVTEVAAESAVDPGRWNLAYRASVARLAAVYAFRPRWRETALAWAEAEWAHRVAGRGDENSLIHVSQRSPADKAGSGS